ncbi:MAG: hypothetical protein Q4G48_08980 [Bacteroidia bacterium]|nr:hypothetical protein [Bacteroidia bacterium]
MKNCILWMMCAALFAACTSKTPEKLADYPSVTKIFTEQETADLQNLLDVFEFEIGIQNEASSEAKVAGYSVFNKQVLASMEEGKLDNYPLSNEQKIKLLDVLHVSTFRSIWSLGVSTYSDGNQYPSFSIHTQGKFMDLLLELSKEYPQFTGLADELRMAGDLIPNFATTLFLQNDKLNMRDARVRLVYAISCLRGDWRN